MTWAAQLALAVDAELIVVHAVGLLEGAELSHHPDGSAALRIAAGIGMKAERHAVAHP